MAWNGKLELHPSPTTVRGFGLRTSLATPVAALVWLGLIRLVSGDWHWTLPSAILSVGLIAGLVCLVAPRAGRPVHVVWHAVVATANWIIVSVILFLVFILVFTPVGLLLRLIGRKSLRLRPDPHLNSYWQTTENVTDLQRYRRQF